MAIEYEFSRIIMHKVLILKSDEIIGRLVRISTITKTLLFSEFSEIIEIKRRN